MFANLFGAGEKKIGWGVFQAPRVLSGLLAATAVIALAGCGGGGGGSTDGGNTDGTDGGNNGGNGVDISRSFSEAAASNFQPNYIADVQEVNLRRWGKRSLSVFVRPDRGTDRTQQVVNELNRWRDATESDFNFQSVGQEDGADLIVEFLPSSEISQGRLGQARVTWSQSTGILFKAEVEVSQDITNDLLPTVIVHETGHALGMNGHSSQQSDMMFGQYRDTMRISERDLNTLFYSYREGRASRPAVAAKDDLRTEIVDCPL